MRYLFQDCEGSIPEVAGRICERLLCVQVLDDENGSLTPSVFWLKIQNGLWHRFFIDSSLYFLSWTEQEEIPPNDLDDEDFPVMDVG